MASKTYPPPYTARRKLAALRLEPDLRKEIDRLIDSAYFCGRRDGAQELCDTVRASLESQFFIIRDREASDPPGVSIAEWALGQVK